MPILPRSRMRDQNDRYWSLAAYGIGNALNGQSFRDEPYIRVVWSTDHRPFLTRRDADILARTYYEMSFEELIPGCEGRIAGRRAQSYEIDVPQAISQHHPADHKCHDCESSQGRFWTFAMRSSGCRVEGSGWDRPSACDSRGLH